MFITTVARTNPQMIKIAQKIGKELNIPYVTRRKQSIEYLQNLVQDDCMVVGKNRLELYPLGDSHPFFFHPNSAMFRFKRLINGEHDPFLEAAQLQAGMTLLDCTAGLAADSIVASFAVGETGKVIGTEANPFLAYIVQEGLLNWDSGITEMNDAMRRIRIDHSYSLPYLKNLEDKSVDCIYFDPMFEESVMESFGIKALSQFAVYDDLSESLIEEALRVTRSRVVLKDHFRSKRFDRYGFKVFRRQSAKFHFGVLEK